MKGDVIIVEGENTEKNPSPTKREVWIELFLLSFLSLFLELLVIRWLSGNYRAFTVFKTFPLAACFVGLGLGYAMPSSNWYRFTPLAVLAFTIMLHITQFSGFWHWVFPSFSIYVSQREQVSADWGYIFQFIFYLIALLTTPFFAMACLGSRLAVLFNELKPVHAYCINIGGSIAGSLTFAALSFAGAPPWALLCVFLVAFWCCSNEKLKLSLILPIVLAGFLSWYQFDSDESVKTYWSPYQRIDVYPFNLGGAAVAPADVGITIAANGHFYQYALDLRENSWANCSTKLKERLATHARNYNLPYKLKSPRTVLILGAGSGNDVAAALRASPTCTVDAVDIDPLIIELGRKHHPEKPYDSPRVSVFCDDARHYLSHCQKKYDLIVFAGLDSLTVTGKGASVRVDNYIFTKDSLESAHSLLTGGDGLLVLSFCNSKPWLTQRLYSTLHTAAGYKPMILFDAASPELPWEIYLSGPLVKQGLQLPNIAPFVLRSAPERSGRILTDDWPFMYVTPVVFDAPYLLVISILLSISVVATRKVLFAKYDGSMWQMFFLGSAFMLLELQSIARLSLVFGSTWWTSAVVINGILLMILAANFLVLKFSAIRQCRLDYLYGLLGLSILGSYFLPMRTLMENAPREMASTAITFLTVLPIFVAGLIFANAFDRSSNAARSLTFNLLGAVLGAMLEYLANYIGISGLVLTSAFLYALSYVCSKLGMAKLN